MNMKKLILMLLAAVAVMCIPAVSMAAETMYVCDVEYAVYLRTAPASDESYGEIPVGARVESVGWQQGRDGEGYNEVIYNGTRGWVKTQYLSYTGYDNVSSRYFGTWTGDMGDELRIYRSGNAVKADYGNARLYSYVLSDLSFINGSTAVSYGYSYARDYSYSPPVTVYSEPMRIVFEFYSDHVYAANYDRATGEYLGGAELY